jgi:hypothetical protein
MHQGRQAASVAEVAQHAGSRQPDCPAAPAGRFAASLACGHVAPDELVRASFEFFLEREPATSILRKFSLDVLSQCFPGFPAEMGARLGGSDPATPQ